MSTALFADDARGAHLSRDGLYRYLLTRTWGSGPSVCFVMLNPSTADANIDDPTIRKCVGFAKRWGAGSLVVVNLFAWRATDPHELAREHGRGVDIVGPENDEFIRTEAHCPRGHDRNDDPIDPPAFVVAAWGRHGSLNGRDRDVVELFETHRVGASCLGTNADGSPRHPLMLAYTTPLVPFDAAGLRGAS